MKGLLPVAVPVISKITSAQVVETSVFENYPHPDDHTRQTTYGLLSKGTSWHRPGYENAFNLCLDSVVLVHLLHSVDPHPIK